MCEGYIKLRRLLVNFQCLLCVAAATLSHFVILEDPVALACGWSNLNRKWMYGNTTLFYNRAFVNRTFKDSIILKEDYTLFIRMASIIHEGYYQCLHGSKVNVTHKLNVIVIPQISITIKGYNYTKTIDVKESEEIAVTCLAVGSRPSAELSLIIENTHSFTVDSVEVTINNNDKQTFDTTAEFRIRLKEPEGMLTCTNRAVYNITESIVFARIPYTVYVLPELILELNDMIPYKGTVTVEHNTTITATCAVRGTRPIVNVTWIIDQSTTNILDKPDSNVNVSWDDDNQTYDVTSILNVLPKSTKGTIICVVAGSYVDEMLNATYFVSKNLREDTTYVDNQDTTPIVSDAGLKRFPLFGILGLVPIVICLMICYLKRLFVNTRAETLNQHVLPDQCLQSTTCDSNIHHAQSTDAFKDLRDTYQLPAPLTSVSRTTLSHPPKIDLPNIPVEPEGDGEVIAKTERVYYSTIKKSVSEGRIYLEDDVCRIAVLKGGGLYNRWMGTMTGLMKGKCVIITTASDLAISNNHINWDMHVKRVLEIPDSESLAKIVGICISSDRLFLLHEHLVCGTLDTRLRAPTNEDNCNNYSAQLLPSTVLEYILSILEGLELIQSYGFLHPGISTKKVLLTKQGVCKLYDFCLNIDAPAVILTKKLEMECLPPETLYRNEYTQESDVWSVAVVIWNLLTQESSPLDSKTEELTFDDESTIQKWPSNYRRLRCNHLFDCWKPRQCLRPTINQLRVSFTEISNSLRELDILETRSDTDIYVPMKGTS